jgi:hypothetical protein
MAAIGFSRAGSVLAVVLAGCGGAKTQVPAPAVDPDARGTGHDLVMLATSCWMGGIWSDALGESGNDRYAGIDRRCDQLLKEVDIPAPERPRALADHVPPPAPEEAYYPLRAVQPAVVEAIAHHVQARAERTPSEAPHARELVSLLRAVAGAAHETVRARRAADTVKTDVLHQPSLDARTADKEAAAPKLSEGDGLLALLRLDAGPFATEAREIGLLSALDRMEIARGLPKHLKLYAVGAAYEGVFGVKAPAIPDDAAVPLKSGTWLTYLTEVAAAAGHPVPAEARDPQNREPLAWTGVLAGLADRMRADQPRVPVGTPLGDVERGVVARLDQECAREHEAYAAHAPADR